MRRAGEKGGWESRADGGRWDGIRRLGSRALGPSRTWEEMVVLGRKKQGKEIGEKERVVHGREQRASQKVPSSGVDPVVFDGIEGDGAGLVRAEVGRADLELGGAWVFEDDAAVLGVVAEVGDDDGGALGGRGFGEDLCLAERGVEGESGFFPELGELGVEIGWGRGGEGGEGGGREEAEAGGFREAEEAQDVLLAEGELGSSQELVVGDRARIDDDRGPRRLVRLVLCPDKRPEGLGPGLVDS
mmetsp:Transcript_1069/g.3154  ORF Transcript_1069/g.3154 Transcript_1069/m.3154 type:complete len:244 (-) Transcript_1069:728-1459(-)